MSTGNKYALLSQVNETRRRVVVTDGLIAKKPKKPSSESTAASAKPASGKPAAHTTAQSAAGGRVAKATTFKKSTGPVSDAPTDLRAAAEFNKKKAEEKAARLAAEAELKAVAVKAAAESAAVKAASEQAQAETLADADAQKEAADEAATSTDFKKKEKPQEPEKKVMSLADFNKERTDNQFVVGQKQARTVDKSATNGLQQLKHQEDKLVIKPKEKEAPKPAAKGAKKPAAAAAAAPKEAKPKSTKVDLSEFANFSAAGRGRGGYSGRGGYRGGDHQQENTRAPKYDDQKAFPSL